MKVSCLKYLFLACVLMLCGNIAQAQSSDVSNIKNTEDGVILNFQNTDILALIDLVSEVTGKNFIVDPRVKAKVTVYSGSALDDKQIYDVFLSILDVNNLSAVEVGDIVKVIPVAGSKQAPLPTSSGNPSTRNSDGLVTQVYKLKHAAAADILPVIRPLIPAESHVAVHSSTGTLVFTDTEANVKRILDILSYLDVSDNTFNIRIIPLKHALAEDIKEAISALVGDIVSESGVASGEAAAARGRKATVYAETSSNSLIINGSEEAFAIISSLIVSLDVERPKTRDVHVVKLKYANAADMSGILNEVAQKLSPSGGATAPDAQQAVSVQVHEPSNTLIIHANQPDFLALKTVIDQIDVRRKQVFIEAIIAEVSFNNSADLGIEWQANIDSRGGGTASTDFTDISGGLSVGLVNNLVLNPLGAVVPDLSVILSALRNDSSTNILSTPTLLTVDNEQAEIVVGQEVPFITGQFTTNNQSTTTTDTTADGTTTTSSVQPFQTIERRDIGLRLTVTPRVNTEGLITMEVEQETSNVSTLNIQGAADLVTDERRITATVQAQSGKIVVIGGLIRDDIFKTDQRVPLLGDIPVVGNLFKRRQDTKVKTNLMVFLRPKIIDESQPIAQETIERYEYIRDLNHKENQRFDNLVSNKNTRLVPPIGSFDDSDQSSQISLKNASDSELIEIIWRYALPQNSRHTEPRF